MYSSVFFCLRINELLDSLDIALVEHLLLFKDFSYARWAPHCSAISAISSNGPLANGFLKNADERFDTHSFIRFLDEQLLPAMNVFDGENP